jgi:serine/threonine protein kinase
MNESRIGPFSLEEKLGGKNSSVYRAIHLEQRKQVVLKVFSVPFGVTEHAGSDFVEEMNILRQLQHSNIVRCFGGKIEGNTGYVASELIDGETMADLLKRKGRLSWDQALEFAQSIAAALHAAQQLDLTHLDLMPDKVLISTSGQIKVADFRRDRARNPWCFSSRKPTRRRTRYQAPEQVRGDGHLSPKADLYALGCLLFHMLTGRPPFVADDVDELRRQQLSDVAPHATSVALDCPVWLDALVAQLLEKDPARRPHSAEAVSLALAEAKKKELSRSSVTQHALGGFSTLRLPVDKHEARQLFGGKRARQENAGEGTPLWERPWFLAIALGALLIVFGTALSFALRPPGEEQLISEAERLMASENSVDWRTAEDRYLQPLLTRFPDSEYVPRAKEHLDTITMHQAEQHAKALARMGRTPTHEGERLYSDALRFEQFGDRLTALDKYQGMVSLLKAEGDDRPFVLLAKRQIAAITQDKSSSAEAREKFIKEKLAQADALVEQGKTLEARKIWYGLESLYGHNAELGPLIDQARARLKTAKAENADHSSVQQ